MAGIHWGSIRSIKGGWDVLGHAVGGWDALEGSWDILRVWDVFGETGICGERES